MLQLAVLLPIKLWILNIKDEPQEISLNKKSKLKAKIKDTKTELQSQVKDLEYEVDQVKDAMATLVDIQKRPAPFTCQNRSSRTRKKL